MHYEDFIIAMMIPYNEEDEQYDGGHRHLRLW
jgi:hypothetical protein